MQRTDRASRNTGNRTGGSPHEFEHEEEKSNLAAVQSRYGRWLTYGAILLEQGGGGGHGEITLSNTNRWYSDTWMISKETRHHLQMGA